MSIYFTKKKSNSYKRIKIICVIFKIKEKRKNKINLPIFSFKSQ